jgi:hypothetical protein
MTGFGPTMRGIQAIRGAGAIVAASPQPKTDSRGKPQEPVGYNYFQRDHNALFAPERGVSMLPQPLVIQQAEEILRTTFPEDLRPSAHSSPIGMMFMGRRGAGKTLTMSAIANFMRLSYINSNSPMRIVANYHVNFATCYPDLVDQLNEYPSWGRNLLACLDEIAAYFPGRRSLAGANVDFSTFLQQIRKRYIEIMMTTQFPQMLDQQLLMQIDLFVDVEYHRRGCIQFQNHRHCVDLYIHDWWGQWTGNNYRKPFPPWRGEADWVKTIHNIGGTFKLYNSQEVVAPLWSQHREDIIQQGWGDQYIEDGKDPDFVEMAPPQNLKEYLEQLNYAGQGFKIKDYIGEVGLHDRRIVNLQTFVQVLQSLGWQIDTADPKTPIAYR